MKTSYRTKSILFIAILLTLSLTGCETSRFRVTPDYANGPAVKRFNGPGQNENTVNEYVGSLNGGQLFKMYCLYCHNWRPITERPFSNYQNVMAHMRARANLTGDEYNTLMEWLRRMQDVPPESQGVDPSPKRMFYSQPIGELKPAPEEAIQEDVPQVVELP